MKEKEFNLDIDRLQRLRMVEAIWGENKSIQQISRILKRLETSDQLALVTRVNEEKASKLISDFKTAKYHAQASCLTLGEPVLINKSLGEVLVVTGGTSDHRVASEAILSLHCHSVKTDLLMDVGISGLHRLLGNLEKLSQAKVVIACAGMEGALPTVIAGLIPQPVIGLPVSVGYGVSNGGHAALQSMLGSCSPGLLVVNIDNGYGAAMAALRILNSSIL
ncbi:MULTISPECIES: nickel pincer cofactor biosynthesis protein LarB [unclassified Prochlorococcus]|uniref:nickel pincer cofactor biosynthesis protein LarB n=1 Tax=unclassified Prochlorococcus TaxID=2627481 RepID=UPI0005336FB0|nr:MULTISPECIES: nickel pincer cofactor biosynthesis protein LarB [unclassified Prochlorococcus]KGG16293.1 Circadian phase modifier [Prochlorococcus sp. MIT 0603]KGG17973.1 Circadian phase modifier [Prochlorococcus sp. MIT 0602]